MSFAICIDLANKLISVNDLYAQRGGRKYMTPEGVRAKRLFQIQIRNQYKGPVITTRVRMAIDMYFRDYQRYDVDNHLKLVQDSLQGLVLVDDKQVTRVEGEKRLGSDRCGARILITPYVPTTPI